MRMTIRRIALIVTFAAMLQCTAGMAGMAGASGWGAGLAGGSSGEGIGGGLPPQTTGATSACTSLVLGTTVQVTWTAITPPAHGNPTITYSVLESTMSATGPYTVAASGITGTSWTSPSLPGGHYWFEVEAVYGGLWVGPVSAATAERSITTVILSLLCT
jgi:hypothetical protein